MRGKVLAVIIIIIIVLAFFGWQQGILPKLPSLTIPGLGTTDSIEPFLKLREKYSVQENYSTNPSLISDYISELSLLRAKSAGSSAKIIDAELNSAEAFYHLSKALEVSGNIDFALTQCNSKEVTQARTYSELAIAYSAKATASIQALNADEIKTLGENKMGLASEYSNIALQISQAIGSVCGG